MSPLVLTDARSAWRWETANSPLGQSPRGRITGAPNDDVVVVHSREEARIWICCQSPVGSRTYANASGPEPEIHGAQFGPFDDLPRQEVHFDRSGLDRATLMTSSISRTTAWGCSI